MCLFEEKMIYSKNNVTFEKKSKVYWIIRHENVKLYVKRLIRLKCSQILKFTIELYFNWSNDKNEPFPYNILDWTMYQACMHGFLIGRSG